MKLSEKKEAVAGCLLSLGAVKLNTKNLFQWASGILSPVYCDNRAINSDIKARNLVLDAFLDLIRKTLPDVALIAGVATGGIPMGMLIADRLELPFVYVRQEPKGHGMKQQVEGSFQEGQKVVLIEDLISTGGSSMKAVTGIRNAGLQLLGLLSIMNYGFEKAEKLFNDEKVTVYSLCNIDTVVDEAEKTGQISAEQKEEILSFREKAGKA
jgi:orotate phosphoribosyltransferase